MSGTPEIPGLLHVFDNGIVVASCQQTDQPDEYGRRLGTVLAIAPTSGEYRVLEILYNGTEWIIWTAWRFDSFSDAADRYLNIGGH
jgi:hypothetical protein